MLVFTSVPIILGAEPGGALLRAGMPVITSPDPYTDTKSQSGFIRHLRTEGTTEVCDAVASIASP
ncbi:MAG: uncharacterized protein KVP18_002305 [Porospora cf. gigantea A]|uniref:uncharacterized protein n=1 Tax=Porospora cf. gigantea A TaxID=2853593 RepID=UPI00355ABAE1|nr:MAG: hypothetical protein KVP18_002305 [Porospora cf. gigantea A]